MPSDEDVAREAIVRYCRRLWQRRLVSGSSGNVSVRLGDGSILITPSQRALAELAPSEIVAVQPSGDAMAPGQRPSSELPLHVAAYAARADIRCVVHTHPTFCVVWSLSGRVFPQETVGARETLGPVGWCAYAPAGSRELAGACATVLAGGTDTVILERHGLTTVGMTLESAFVLTDLAEEAARVAYHATVAGWG